MGKKAKGRSLNRASDYYDFLTPAERSRFRRKQIDLVNLKEGENVLDVNMDSIHQISTIWQSPWINRR